MLRLCAIILIFIFVDSSFSKATLSLPDVCEAYSKCSEQLAQTHVECGKYSEIPNKSKHEKISKSLIKSCGSAVYSDYELYEQQIALSRIENTQCIREAVYNNTAKMGSAKVNFCSQFMRPDAVAVDEPITRETCWTRIKRIENKCSALKQCCDPAGRCEQVSQHSQSGRTVRGLKEEIMIKIAVCKERREKKQKIKKVIKDTAIVPSSTTTAVKISEVDHCKAYLACQKNMVHLRTNCGVLTEMPKSGDQYEWTLTYNSLPKSLDDKDLYCKKKYTQEYEELLEKRKKAEQYLDHCVPTANITRELIEKQSPCQPELLTVLPRLGTETRDTCLGRIHKQKEQCLLLRDCCVQADVCERNALYGVLADDFLLAEIELKTKMNYCYHN